MKNILVVFLVVFFAGCAETSQRIDSIVDDPGTIFQDPGFAAYEQELNTLEKQYLQKEITYAQYLEGKKQLEENYERDVKHQETEVDDPLNSPGANSETFR